MTRTFTQWLKLCDLWNKVISVLDYIAALMAIKVYIFVCSQMRAVSRQMVTPYVLQIQLQNAWLVMLGSPRTQEFCLTYYLAAKWNCSSIKGFQLTYSSQQIYHHIVIDIQWHLILWCPLPNGVCRDSSDTRLAASIIPSPQSVTRRLGEKMPYAFL